MNFVALEVKPLNLIFRRSALILFLSNNRLFGSDDCYCLYIFRKTRQFITRCPANTSEQKALSHGPAITGLGCFCRANGNCPLIAIHKSSGILLQLALINDPAPFTYNWTLHTNLFTTVYLIFNSCHIEADEFEFHNIKHIFYLSFFIYIYIYL